MDEIGLKDDSRELQALRQIDYSTDGVISMSRAHSAEQEILRDGTSMFSQGLNEILNDRGRLLAAASHAPKVMRGYAFTPLDDRLLVKLASFDEGYVCEECKGAGHTDSVCTSCNGSRVKRIEKITVCMYCDGTGKLGAGTDAKCPRCEGKGQKTSEESHPCSLCIVVGAKDMKPHSCGHLPCPTCSGSGLAEGVMAIPDASQQDHSYGDILVAGSQIHDLQAGDRVVFSKMAGIWIRGDEQKLILMRRGEVMGLMTK